MDRMTSQLANQLHSNVTLSCTSSFGSRMLKSPQAQHRPLANGHVSTDWHNSDETYQQEPNTETSCWQENGRTIGRYTTGRDP